MRILLIPSAKIISEDLQSKFGKIPTVLIPVGNLTVLDELYKNYNDKYDKIYIIIKEKSKLIKDYLKNKKYNIEVIELQEVRDLGYSIFWALENLYKTHNNIKELVINFGDTLGEYHHNDNENIIYYDLVSDCERWTTFNIENNDINIIDKQIQIADEFNTFIGIFKISNVKEFYDRLLIQVNKISDIDSFYRTIKEYNKTNKFHLKKTGNWLDLGHIDNYNVSKKDVQARYFNSINIERKKGILRKTSTDKEKFKNEILWYLKLPNTIQYLAPRIFDYSIDYNDMYINMEYYGYSTVHEMFIYGELNKKQWKQIYDSIFLAIKDMRSFKQNVDREEIHNTLEDMYLNKTIQRLNKVKEDKKFDVFFNKNIIINNKEYKNLNYYIDNISDILEKNNLFDLESLSIIHGDLCFANILYDLDSQIIRLIDPRGKFGEYDVYGDYRYDLAKLSHSVNGRYDYIINDLFDIDVQENKVDFTISCTENSKLAKQIFSEYLDDEVIHQIGLIEALLFLSMIPLHKDYPNRQLAMLCTGIKLIDKYTE